MPMLKFIGRGSCSNHKEGNNSAYIKRDDSLLLIDCGCNISDRIRSSTLLNGIKHVSILITHFHDDHVGSLCSFLLHCKYNLNIIPEVYFEDRHYLINFLAMQGILENEVYTCMKSPRIDEMDITFTAFETNHYEFFKPDASCCYRNTRINNIIFKNYFHCYGYFIIDKSDKSKYRYCYYSGDSNEVKKPIKMAVIAGTIELYQDTCLNEEHGHAHLPLSSLCKIFASEYRSKVYCMHIDSDELISEAKKYGFNIVDVEI